MTFEKDSMANRSVLDIWNVRAKYLLVCIILEIIECLKVPADEDSKKSLSALKRMPR